MTLAHSSAEGGASIPTELVARLEVSEAGSDELSARVMMLFRAPDGRVEQSPINGAWCVYDARGRIVENSSRDGWWRRDGWSVTTSLDAALALAERVLPDAMPTLDQREKGAWLALLGESPNVIDAWAATAPLALCAAVLKATTASAVGTSESE